MPSDMTQVATDLTRQALIVSMKMALPMLLAGLIVGLAVSLFQTLTQLQEQTLTFIPKILSIGGMLALLTPWMLTVIADYTKDMIVLMRTLTVG